MLNKNNISLDEVITQCLTKVRQFLSEANPNARQSTQDSQSKLEYSLRFLITNALSVPEHHSALIHKRSGAYSENSIYYDPQLSYRVTIKNAYEPLCKLGYLTQTKHGHYFRTEEHRNRIGGRTEYRATRKLLDLLGDNADAIPALIPLRKIEDTVRVQIKNPKGDKLPKIRLLPAHKTRKSVAVMKRNLARINETLARHWIDLEVPDEDGTVGAADHLAASNIRNPDISQKQLAKAYWRYTESINVNFQNRQLYRVFNDRNLSLGGRFYGGFWQEVTKLLRQRLTIDGRRTVEIDYSGLHPSILYALEGQKRPLDAYSGILPRQTNQKNTKQRSALKIALNAMLNAGKDLPRKPRSLDLNDVQMTWTELKQSIMEFHKPIAHYFGTGAGLKLQKEDSDLAEQILLYFAERDVVCLPVHDSFLIHEEHQAELKEVMHQVFMDKYGVAPDMDITIRQASFRTMKDTESWSCYKRTNCYLNQ